jgi:NAD(P)-dependent dehydrogenase (short-subunit alcohol dehydrogenase family)
MTHNPSHAPVCVVVGAGPGNGAAFVRRFAAEGYAVAMIARSAAVMDELAAKLPLARGYLADIADPTAVEKVFATVAEDLGPVDVLIYNAGKGVWGSAEDISLADFELSWRVNTLGAIAAARAVIPAMKAKGAGQIVFIGATASRRGGAKTAAFASAKAAQRSLAESLARSLGPMGIHVSLIIVDGIVDEPLMRAKLADKPDDFFIKPNDIADSAVMLTRQKSSAWSFEIEARPFGEVW